MAFALLLLRRSTCWLVCGLLLLSQGPVAAQNASARHRYWEAPPDSLRRVLATQRTDTGRLRTLLHLLDVVDLPDEAAEAARLSSRLRRPERRAYRLQAAGQQLFKSNAPALALDSLQAAVAEFDRLHRPVPMLVLSIRYLFPPARLAAKRAYYESRLATYRQRGDTVSMAFCIYALGGCFNAAGDKNQAIGHWLQAARLFHAYRRGLYYSALAAAGAAYAEWGNLDKAQYYLRQSLAGAGSRQNTWFRYLALAQVQLKLGDYPAAWRSLDQSIAGANGNKFYQAPAYLLKSAVLLAQQHPAAAAPLLRTAQHLDDSLHLPLIGGAGTFELEATWAQYYAATGDAARAEAHWLAAYRQAWQGHYTYQRLAYLRELTRFYQQQQRPAVAAAYAVAALGLSDTLTAAQGRLQVSQFEIEQANQAQTLRIAGLRQTQVQDAARARRQRYVLGGVLVVLALLAGMGFVLWRVNRRQQRANALLSQQKAEIQAQRDQTTQALTKLQVTQAQLIQKEKMASLGELTAGIAHEIQNPLNFVNNFSEVSAELVAELKQELDGGDLAEAHALADDLAQNLDKITQHGQRAASIVRGMLEHSRQSTGERAPVDISALCDEYLRLAYHGLRAKDKSFNAELKTDFAPGLPLVEGVGADLGRVLLNLFNNAFYAVQQRQRASEAGYAPTVSVSTKSVGQLVEIRVRDNGTGMPESVRAKIFQPFFTTKPTGEGTGLGLSLAHDIIAQGHGGTLAVESQAGQGTEFLITLPIA